MRERREITTAEREEVGRLALTFPPQHQASAYIAMIDAAGTYDPAREPKRSFRWWCLIRAKQRLIDDYRAEEGLARRKCAASGGTKYVRRCHSLVTRDGKGIEPAKRLRSECGTPALERTLREYASGADRFAGLLAACGV